ncbi:phosphoadenylyl-sulfate reductase [Alkalibaculum sp. M08DMB]|uniref:Adenosine 5'-phosphosulfate reductase n=1 Tax=Alkalibaculum sporogenes TaxID=2655001 RepID=A0A6A7K5G9_9FIRM|nr:phosphoadenylyl-sulfate reductase [Alkalibaculum sporogenes]MPW24668.1 phosphoadenylyl-sulfate reductase [Alkalibaculum sporogenes]
MEGFNLDKLNAEYVHKEPKEIIKYMVERIGVSKITLASSLSIEDQVLTDILLKVNPKARIFFIDTGRHFQKTYDLMDETMKRYNFNYELYVPQSEELEKMVADYGPNSFYESVELRKNCCEIRKVRPLRRVLTTVDAWICGLRKEQSLTRQDVEIFEWDKTHSIYKINPIAYWNEKDLWNYIKRENVPYSELYHDGFASIGCQPCTRSINKGDDLRSGRWWWEDADKKECGLHWDTDLETEMIYTDTKGEIK